MKNIIFKLIILFVVVVSASSCNKNNLQNFQADKHLSIEEIEAFKYNIIRYMGKMHKKANYNNRFDSFFNEYYIDLAKKHELKYYVPQHSDGYTYFCIYRTAPSMRVMKVALAGRLKYDQNDSLTHYEEIYRTWKFEEEELTRKNDFLFAKLLKGDDLSPYHNHNSGEEEWIEFPDRNVVFDIKLRRWIAIDLNEEAKTE